MFRDTIIVIVATLFLVIATVVGSSVIDRNRSEVANNRLEACFDYGINEFCDYPPTPTPEPTPDTDIRFDDSGDPPQAPSDDPSDDPPPFPAGDFG